MERGCCWWGGRSIRTTHKRWSMWQQVMTSHYALRPEHKVRALVRVCMLAAHPTWDAKQAYIAQANMRTPHGWVG